MDRLQAAADRFIAARGTLATALVHRERALAQVHRRLASTTGGLEPEHATLTRKRRRINTIADAMLVARAARSRQAAEAARDAFASIRAEEDGRVRAAEGKLSTATVHLRSFGALGNQIIDEATAGSAAGSVG